MKKQRETPKSLKKFWISFWMYAIGEFLIYSAFGALLNLQSSINVVDGLGTINIAIFCGSSVLFSLFFFSISVRRFGLKKCICGSGVTYVIYTLANMYPSFYTMIPASIIVGAGDSILWGCMASMNSFYAKQFAIRFGDIGKNYESKFSGYFFAVFQMAKITGNLISYTVIYAFNKKDAINATNILTNVTFSQPDMGGNPLNYCGSNDCQDAEIIANALDQYVPASKVTIYVLMGVMALICCAAVVIHVIFLPNVEERGMTNIDNLKHQKESETVPMNSSCEVNSINAHGTTIDDTSEPMQAKNNIPTHERTEESLSTRKISQNESFISSTIKTLRDVGLQLVHLKQLLISPIIFYLGLDFGFITSELTRSYSSCVFGVAWVPIHYVFYGLGAAIMCYIIGKLSKYISRNMFIGMATILDSVMYTYILFWTPFDATHASIIPVYLLLGAMAALWLTITQVVEIDYFPDRLDTAGPVWGMWYTIGMGVQFAWSTSMCVRTKIYTQLGVLAFSILCYGIVEKLIHRPKSLVNTEEKQSEIL